MSKQSTLETLLATFDKTEQLRAETEALKPRLETEINDALASGDVLDEKLASSLQIKRAQLDLIPAKLGQISAKTEELSIAIQAEFTCRCNIFGADLRMLQNATVRKVVSQFDELGIERLVGEQLALQGVWRQTRLNNQLIGLDDAIRFQVSQQNFIGAARELLRQEKILQEIKSRPEISAMLETFGQKS